MMGQKKIDKETFTSLLDMLITDLQDNKKLMPKGFDKREQLIEVVYDKIFGNPNCNLLQFNFDARDNKEGINNLLEMLSLSLKAEFESNKELNPAAKLDLDFDYSKFFSDEFADKDELKKALKAIFKKINSLTPTPKFTDKQIDQMSEKIAEKIMQKKKKLAHSEQEQPAQNNLFTDVATEALCTLFGGVNPTMGGQARAVHTVLGDFMGLADYDPGNGIGSYMTKRNRAEPGDDPTGAEANAITNAISNGTFGDELYEVIEMINHPSQRLNQNHQ